MPDQVSPSQSNADLLLFDESMPVVDLQTAAGFRSECVPDKKVKVEDLFRFKRRVCDYHVSLAALLIAIFFLVFFWSSSEGQTVSSLCS